MSHIHGVEVSTMRVVFLYCVCVWVHTHMHAGVCVHVVCVVRLEKCTWIVHIPPSQEVELQGLLNTAVG